MSVAGSDASSRPHIAARLDDQVTGLTNQLFRRRGWQPRIVPYTGYGSTEWIRILARVLLAPPRGAEPVDTETTVARQQTTRGWRRFLTTPIEDVEVEVDIGGRTHLLRTARRGGTSTRRCPPGSRRVGSGRVGTRFSYGRYPGGDTPAPTVDRRLEHLRAEGIDFYSRLGAARFMLDYGDDDSGLFMKYLRRVSGYYIDVGASELVANGDIKLESGVDAT
jgi:hypothetical protein